MYFFRIHFVPLIYLYWFLRFTPTTLTIVCTPCQDIHTWMMVFFSFVLSSGKAFTTSLYNFLRSSMLKIILSKKPVWCTHQRKFSSSVSVYTYKYILIFFSNDESQMNNKIKFKKYTFNWWTVGFFIEIKHAK